MVLCDDLSWRNGVRRRRWIQTPRDAAYEASAVSVAGVVGVVEYQDSECPPSRCRSNDASSRLSKSTPHCRSWLIWEGAYSGLLFDGLGVAQPVAGHHGVVDMFVEVVEAQIGDRCHSTSARGRTLQFGYSSTPTTPASRDMSAHSYTRMQGLIHRRVRSPFAIEVITHTISARWPHAEHPTYMLGPTFSTKPLAGTVGILSSQSLARTQRCEEPSTPLPPTRLGPPATDSTWSIEPKAPSATCKFIQFSTPQPLFHPGDRPSFPHHQRAMRRLRSTYSRKPPRRGGSWKIRPPGSNSRRFRCGGGRIVDGVVESEAFRAFLGLTHYEVSDVDDVAQLAYLAEA